jgi:hypothetical protein
MQQRQWQQQKVISISTYRYLAFIILWERKKRWQLAKANFSHPPHVHQNRGLASADARWPTDVVDFFVQQYQPLNKEELSFTGNRT